MSTRNTHRARVAPRLIAALLAAGLIFAAGTFVWAGHLLFRTAAVGGVSIDAQGVVGQPSVEARNMLRVELQKSHKKPPVEMNAATELRKISLRGLEAAVEHALKNNLGVLPDEVKYLGGIQRIQYVFVYPEQNDIVLAGPGEGWRIDENANVVGVTTGRPVIHIDDLLVAFRTVDEARAGGITCSIDPRAEGRVALDAFLKQQKVFTPAVIEGIEKTLGPQQISLTGVDPSTHFARVLVACDYRMKRYAMHLEKAPIAGLPSYLDMIATATVGAENMMPRWWLTTNYEPLGRGDDGLAWEIRGAGVKCMTEDDFIAADGAVKTTGRRNPVAQKWADAFTAKYDELSARDPVFGELRNLMDLCVAAALIEKEGLLARADCKLPLITSSDSQYLVDSWNAPKTVATQSSFIKKGSNYIITASGGVQVESWQAASRSEPSDKAPALRGKAAPAGQQWWWN